MKFIAGLLVLFFGLATSEDIARSLKLECDKSFSITCLKLRAVSFIDRWDQSDFEVLPGVKVVRENNVNGAKTTEMLEEIAREFKDDPDGGVDSLLMSKVTDYLNNHSLKLKLFDEETAGEIVEARKKKKKIKAKLGLLLKVGALLKGVLGALALGGLAILAKKALITSVISLALSGLLAFKTFFMGKNKQRSGQEVEVIAAPTYAIHHDDVHGGDFGGHGGFGTIGGFGGGHGGFGGGHGGFGGGHGGFGGGHGGGFGGGLGGHGGPWSAYKRNGEVITSGTITES